VILSAILAGALNCSYLNVKLQLFFIYLVEVRESPFVESPLLFAENLKYVKVLLLKVLFYSWLKFPSGTQPEAGESLCIPPIPFFKS
jgi:hypothetical protein